MKTLFLSLLTVLSFSAISQIQVPDTHVSFELPDEEWQESDGGSNGNLSYTMWNYMAGIKDSLDMEWHPSITYMREELPSDDMDVLIYYAGWRSRLPPHDLVAIHTWESADFIESKDVLCIEITYMDGETEHTVYDAFILSDGYGIQLMMDCPSSLLEKVAPEFHKTLRSIKTEK